MNGKALLVILVIAILLLAVYFLYFNADNSDADISINPAGDNSDVGDPNGFSDDDDNMSGDQVSATGSGVIASINAEGATVDGPYIITTTASGTSTPLVIAVPSMGINLCAARADIADMSSLEVGDRIEVRGNIDADGNIVPCEDIDHYLRVVSA